MRRTLALVTLLALVASGCVAPGQEAEPASAGTTRAGPFVDPIIEDHEHTDLATHDLSDRVEMLGHSDLAIGGATFRGFAEMDWVGTLAAVSAVEQASGQGAVIFVDISDPAGPTPLGWIGTQENAHPLDVKFDEKGEFVYASGMGRILVIDARDPTAPALAGAALPPGAACHMSAIGLIDGVEHFFCTGDPAGLTIYRIAEAGDQRALVPVGHSRPSYQVAPVTGAGTFGAVGAPHDMTFQLDPVDGTPLLVVSNRGYGVRVLDVSTPSAPTELGHWTGEGAEHTPLHWHTSMVTVVNGTRVLITSPEILPDDTTPPAVWVLDATDYGAMKLLAEWTAPGDHGSPGFTFTTHQWQVANEHLYLGYYHAGVWVLDLARILADDTWRDDASRPDVLGYYLPHEKPTREGAMVPNVWDLTLREGVMFVTDIDSGLYALRHLDDTVGDKTLTGFS